MALGRTKPHVNNESFHQRYSELSDEIRAKNKREDRLLDVRLKYFEREKNIRLNILRKEQHQLECTRASLCEDMIRIQHDKQRHSIPSYIPKKPIIEPPVLQLSTPELFNIDWEPISKLIPNVKPVTPINIVRPHSAG